MISQDSSDSVVKDAGVRYGGPWFKLCMVSLLSTFFMYIFYPTVTALLEYLDPTILHLFGFCFIVL